MTALAFLASAVLVIIAAVHLLWAVGYWWPIRNEADLARTVTGFRGITKMPGAVSCSVVVVALLFAAAWPWFPDTMVKSAGLLIIALVFQIRAIITYSTFWKRLTPEQPFRRLDETYYGPLCIVLGIIYMVLAGQAMA